MAMRALDSFMPKQRERRDGGGGTRDGEKWKGR
jgi:hypothetical protein